MDVFNRHALVPRGLFTLLTKRLSGGTVGPLILIFGPAIALTKSPLFVATGIRGHSRPVLGRALY